MSRSESKLFCQNDFSFVLKNAYDRHADGDLAGFFVQSCGFQALYGFQHAEQKKLWRLSA